ncbi:BTB/POZ domain-containing protein [Platanthera zijinensis]|uniref:BTB/POZ domain-containing protein n=1 Tax=Platanthera zijinensis TaxID=2320716 RepID=A0AAP0GEL3_9ASPA
MLWENNVKRSRAGDLSKQSLYSACKGFLSLLRLHFLRVTSSDLAEAAQIVTQADNLHWFVDIMIDRQIVGDFLRTWVTKVELVDIQPQVPTVHQYKVTRITAWLFIGMGKGHILVSKEVRCMLLQTWLQPFYEDFRWMRRACKGLDRRLIEDVLNNTILTLLLAMQQDILLAWFVRFLNSGDDCPNIQQGFDVWWRHTFWRPNGETNRPPQLRISDAYENSS